MANGDLKTAPNSSGQALAHEAAIQNRLMLKFLQFEKGARRDAGLPRHTAARFEDI